MRQFNKFRGTRGFLKLADYALRWAYMITEKAKQKARVLAFWDKHGLQATMEAFDVKRRTLFEWKRQFKQGGQKAEALNEKSKAPKITRKRSWSPEVLSEIKRLRQEHPNLGKDKIYPELLNFVRKEN